MPKKLMDTSSHLVESLKSNNETLQNIDRQFIQLMNRYHIFFFHEGKPTDLKGTLRFVGSWRLCSKTVELMVAQVVDEESASPTVQDVERAVIQADHSHMCKFENDSAPGFDMVAEGIQRYAEAAPEMVKSRWEAEKGERSIQMRAAAAELDPGYGVPCPNSTSTHWTNFWMIQKREIARRERRIPSQRAHSLHHLVRTKRPCRPPNNMLNLFCTKIMKWRRLIRIMKWRDRRCFGEKVGCCGVWRCGIFVCCCC